MGKPIKDLDKIRCTTEWMKLFVMVRELEGGKPVFSTELLNAFNRYVGEKHDRR